MFRSTTAKLPALRHLLLQTRGVSGTAKGKIKDGKVLKRSRITTKKGQQNSSTKDAGHKKSPFEQTIDDCLLAAAPVRFLKPREREREAEREKMGLISEARKLEIDKFKKESKSKSKANDNVDRDVNVFGPEGFDLVSLGLVDTEMVPKYELTVEDGRKLAKEFSRVLMRKHRARQAAESALFKCKKEAIEALPEGLREKALVPDLSPFPMNRFMATLTPPIEGYIEKVNEAARRSSATKAKLR